MKKKFNDALLKYSQALGHEFSGQIYGKSY